MKSVKRVVMVLCMLFGVMLATQQVSATEITNISVNSDVYGNLHDYSNIKWFQFQTPQNGYVTISIRATDITECENSKWTIDYYDEDMVWRTGRDTGNGSTVKIPCTAGKINYIKLSNYNYYSSEIDYTLRVNYTPASNWEIEGNGKTESATPIKSGVEYNGIIFDSDTDWYKINVTDNSKVTFDFAKENVYDGGSWEIYIYNKDNNYMTIFRCVDSKESTTFLLKKGVYYINISKYTYSALDSHYKFKVTANKYNITGKTQTKNVKYCLRTSLFGQKSTQIMSLKLLKKAKNASNYEIKVAKKKNMKGVVKKIDGTIKGKTIIPEGDDYFKQMKYFYLQVRPYNTDIFGERWYGSKSNIGKIKNKNYGK